MTSLAYQPHAFSLQLRVQQPWHALMKQLRQLSAFSLWLRLALVFTIVTGGVLTAWLGVSAQAQQTHALAQATQLSPIAPYRNTGVGTNHPSTNTTPLSNQASAPAGVQPLSSPSQPWGSQGAAPFYTYITLTLNDHTQLKVNVTTGNLLFISNDMHLHGTGLDLDIASYYNSQGANWYQEHGKGWTFSVGASVYLDTTPANGVIVHGPSNYEVYFAKNADGSFTDAPGLNATLKKNADTTYTLTFHKTGMVMNFGIYTSVSSIKDRNNNTISVAYDLPTSTNRTASITDTQGRVVTFSQNASHQITGLTDPTSRLVGYGYDGSGHLTSIDSTSSNTSTLGYTGDLLTSYTDPLTYMTAISYLNDGSKRVSQITDATGLGHISFTYNSGNTVVTDQNGHNTTYTYNSLGQVTQTTDALSHSSTSTFDALTYNVTQYGDALSDFTNFTFSTDGRNNLKTVADGTGAATTFGYPTSGNNLYSPLSQTDPQGHQTDFAYDTVGNMLSAIDHTTTKGVIYTYNSNGTVATQKDGRGKIITFSYDTNGNLKTVTPPAPLGAITLTVDALSRVKTVKDGKGQTTTYTYDNDDRVSHIDYNGVSSITYNFDSNNGNLISVQDNTGTTSFQYNEINRLLQKQLPSGTLINSDYDKVGNLTSFEDAGGVVTYGYDNANRMTSLVEPGSATTTYGYDNANRRTSIHYPNGTGQVMTYDAAGHILTDIGGKMNAGGSITTQYINFGYSYTVGTSTHTALLQKTTYTNPVTLSGTLVRSYTYDTQNRLTGATTTSGSTTVNAFSYGYDDASNMTSSTRNLGGSAGTYTSTYSYNDANELTSQVQTHGTTSTITFTYDANGNQTGSTGGPSFTYNQKNQSTAIGSNSYTYSGPDQTDRVGVNTDTAVNSGLGLSSVTTSAGTTYYVRCSCGLLNNLRTPTGQKYYYLFDGLGSIVGMTDSAGNDVNRYDYEPYGQILNSQEQSGINNPWKFAGGYLDSSTGLYKYGIRYYNPLLGRWTQRMPVGGSLAETTKANPYVYAADDPVNLVDPSGRDAVGDLLVCAAAGFGGFEGFDQVAGPTVALGGWLAIGAFGVPVVGPILSLGVILLTFIVVTYEFAITWNTVIAPTCHQPQIKIPY